IPVGAPPLDATTASRPGAIPAPSAWTWDGTTRRLRRPRRTGRGTMAPLARREPDMSLAPETAPTREASPAPGPRPGLGLVLGLGAVGLLMVAPLVIVGATTSPPGAGDVVVASGVTAALGVFFRSGARS